MSAGRGRVSGRRGRILAHTAALLAAFGACSIPIAAEAHDARPLSVSIVEQGEGLYRVVLRAPPTLETANAPSIVWPETCNVRETAPLRMDLGGTSLIACRGGLEGRTLEVRYPVYNPSITTLFRVEAASGNVTTAVLPPDELRWVVPEEPSWLTVAKDYLITGFEHIWGGPDHLLFVAGLMLLARRPRRILLAVTGFTAAHSLTLSLATLGFVRVPIAPVEAMIALSVLFLAGEVAREGSDSFSHRYPIVLSFVFGLLHGFGFASALGEIGLPTRELATGLLCFNLGVELGQIAFIAVAASAVMAWQRVRVLLEPPRGAVLEARARVVGTYMLGVPAAFWFFERAAVAFGA